MYNKGKRDNNDLNDLNENFDFRLTRNANPPRLMFRSSSVPRAMRSAAITSTRRWRRSFTRRSVRRRSSTCARSTSRCPLLHLRLLRYFRSRTLDLGSGTKERATRIQRPMVNLVQKSDSESILII